jgi:ABC-2 type transport system permease protein
MNNPAIKALIGDTLVNIYSFEGVISLKGFSMIGLIIGGWLAFLTASFAAGEIERKTSDLMLSLPVSRAKLLLTRYLSMVPLVALAIVGLFAGIVLGANASGQAVNLEWFVWALIFLFGFALAAGAMSLFISAISSDGKKAALISIGILALMYFMETIGSQVSYLNPIRLLSLFHYANLAAIINQHILTWADLGVLLAVAAIFVGLALWCFQRRDINIS